VNTGEVADDDRIDDDGVGMAMLEWKQLERTQRSVGVEATACRLHRRQ
jgi:hypothetical protein